LSENFRDFVDNLNSTLHQRLNSHERKIDRLTATIDQLADDKIEELSNRTLVAKLNSTIHHTFVNRQYDIDEYFEDKNNEINDKIDELEGFADTLESYDNLTVGQALTYAYINAKYDIKKVRVVDSNGQPIAGATVNVYDNYYNYNYDSDNYTNTYTTDADGYTSTTRFARDDSFYVNVSKSGYNVNGTN
jgi:hypothetical protein